MSDNEHQLSKEDVTSERQHFDKYYLARRGSINPLEPIWTEKAIRAKPRPLDYWEYTFYLVGDLRGKRVLDIGCGGGWLTRMLALKGGMVSAVDISREGCISTRLRLQRCGLPSDSICVMDAHCLGFAPGSFDLVLMAGALHHVNIHKVASEVFRLLKPGGRVVFYEPLRYGRFMRFLKDVWLKAKGLRDYGHTEHEEALLLSDLSPFSKLFSKVFTRRFNFLAKTDRLDNRFGIFARSLRWADYILFSILPPLQRFCTCVVCQYEK